MYPLPTQEKDSCLSAAFQAIFYGSTMSICNQLPAATGYDGSEFVGAPGTRGDIRRQTPKALRPMGAYLLVAWG